MTRDNLRVIDGGLQQVMLPNGSVVDVQPPVRRVSDSSPELKRWAEASAFEAYIALRDGDFENAERLSAATLGALKVLRDKR